MTLLSRHLEVGHTFYDDPERFTLVATLQESDGSYSWKLYYDEVTLDWVMTHGKNGQRPIIAVLSNISYDCFTLLKAYKGRGEVVYTSSYASLVPVNRLRIETIRGK